MSNSENNVNRNVATDGADRVEDDSYDRHIIPAETAARREREGNLFKTHPTEEREASAPTDDQTDNQSIRTTDGYTVDKEGLVNNYAIEPEMYYEVPGDAREQAEEDKAARVEELREINQNSQGDLTEEGDRRGRGAGAV
ncbi:MAG: hypothetical protein LH660_03810 [Phormidesmis sp. CAN_BIN36]|nr:hypothetical protein [Phormidesmis sp. CAN_BIN36]